MSSDRYIAIGYRCGAVTGALTFIASWIYCIAEYGFLVGVGLGWLPSAIAAAVVGGLTVLLWGLVAAGAAIGLLFWISSSPEQSTPSADDLVPAADAAAAPAADAAAMSAGQGLDALPEGYVPRPEPSGNDDSSSPQQGTYEQAHGSSACTEDCSGHQAGYDWAERKGIDDQDDCTGNSTSFVEGCQAYVEDHGA